MVKFLTWTIISVFVIFVICGLFGVWDTPEYKPNNPGTGGVTQSVSAAKPEVRDFDAELLSYKFETNEEILAKITNEKLRESIKNINELINSSGQHVFEVNFIAGVTNSGQEGNVKVTATIYFINDNQVISTGDGRYAAGSGSLTNKQSTAEKTIYMKKGETQQVNLKGKLIVPDVEMAIGDKVLTDDMIVKQLYYDVKAQAA